MRSSALILPGEAGVVHLLLQPPIMSAAGIESTIVPSPAGTHTDTNASVDQKTVVAANPAISTQKSTPAQAFTDAFASPASAVGAATPAVAVQSGGTGAASTISASSPGVTNATSSNISSPTASPVSSPATSPAADTTASSSSSSGTSQAASNQSPSPSPPSTTTASTQANNHFAAAADAQSSSATPAYSSSSSSSTWTPSSEVWSSTSSTATPSSSTATSRSGTLSQALTGTQPSEPLSSPSSTSSATSLIVHGSGSTAAQGHAADGTGTTNLGGLSVYAITGIVAGILIVLAAVYFIWDRWRKQRRRAEPFRLSQWFHHHKADDNDSGDWSQALITQVGPATGKRPASSFFVGSRSEKVPMSPTTVGGVAGVGAGGIGVAVRGQQPPPPVQSSLDPFADPSSSPPPPRLMATNPDPTSRPASTIAPSPASKYSTDTRRSSSYGRSRHLTSTTTGTDLFSIYGEAGSHASTIGPSSIHSSVYGAYESLREGGEQRDRTSAVPPVPALPAAAATGRGVPTAAMASSPGGKSSDVVPFTQHQPLRWGSMVLPMT